MFQLGFVLPLFSDTRKRGGGMRRLLKQLGIRR